MEPKAPKHILAVTGLITNHLGEVLMIRSPRRGWEIPGGQVEVGESLHQALAREIHEETGITAKVGVLAGIYSNLKPPPLLILGFLCDWASGDPCTSDESLETEWVERSEVQERVTHPAIFARIKDLLEFSGRIKYRVYKTDPYQIYGEYYLNSLDGVGSLD
jgi:8-oxo-dGTP diphosphatase